MPKTAAWQRKAGKSKSGGLNAKGRASYKGGTLKAPTKSKTSGRRKSFCARMGGMKKAVGEHKAYTIIEQEVQDLQKDEEKNDR